MGDISSPGRRRDEKDPAALSSTALALFPWPFTLPSTATPLAVNRSAPPAVAVYVTVGRDTLTGAPPDDGAPRTVTGAAGASGTRV